MLPSHLSSLSQTWDMSEKRTMKLREDEKRGGGRGEGTGRDGMGGSEGVQVRSGSMTKKGSEVLFISVKREG